MKNWIGKWVMSVALGHTVIAAVFFGSAYQELLAKGLFNTVTSTPAGLAVWFVLFGFLLFIVGMLISAIEKNRVQAVPVSVGIALLLLTVLGVVLMPVSGFWLMLPAIGAIFIKGRANKLPVAA